MPRELPTVGKMNLLVDVRKLMNRRGQPRGLSLEKPLTLRANFTWTFVGNVIYSASQWGMLTVMAKLGSPEMVGRFSLGLAICAPVVLFANLQLRVVQATDAKQDYQFGDYLGVRLVAVLLALLVIVGILVFSGYPHETALVILVIGFAKVFESVSDVMYGLFQKYERMDCIAISKSIKGPLSLFVLGGLVWMTDRVLYGVLGLAVAWLLLLLVYDLRNASLLASIRPRIDWDTSWRLVRLALPLGLVTMLISLNSNVPRYFVERYMGEGKLGYFSAMAYLMVAGNTVVGALGQSATPRLARHYAAGDRRAFSRLLLQLVGIGGAMGVMGVAVAGFFGRPILALLYRLDYAAHANVLVWLMAAAGVGYVASFLGYGMTSARSFRVQLPLFAVVALSVAAACALLVPKTGLVGAAQASLVGALLNLAGSAVVVAHALHAVGRRVD